MSPNSHHHSSSQSQLASAAPPLLRIAASPHDSHLLATFAQDSRIIRILDHRQPGQALLELHGHSAAINCIDWSPSRRGMLASGGDDSMVLYWDLINSGNSAQLDASHGGTGSANGINPFGGPSENGSAGGAGGNSNAKGPASSWRCDFEVSNISWSPQSNQGGGDWLGVVGGKGVWGVQL